MGFFSWLFDSSEFTPRAACGAWTPALIFSNQSAHLLIFTAYAYVPLVMRRLYWSRRNDFPGTWLLPCFAAFIAACGVGHLLDVLAFYWPAYRFVTLSAWVTAVASWATAVAFRRASDDLVKYPSLRQYEAALQEARNATASVERVAAHLERELARVTQQEMADPENHWLRSRHAILDRIVDALAQPPDPAPGDPTPRPGGG